MQKLKQQFRMKISYYPKKFKRQRSVITKFMTVLYDPLFSSLVVIKGNGFVSSQFFYLHV
jgi:hypothetical protein